MIIFCIQSTFKYIIKFNMRYKPCAKWSVKHRNSSLCIDIKHHLLQWRLSRENMFLFAFLTTGLGEAHELYTPIFVFVILFHPQSFQTHPPKRCYSWYQVWFRDAFELSMYALKFAKNIRSQCGNFLPTSRLCLNIFATLRWCGEEGQQPPTKDQESFRQLNGNGMANDSSWKDRQPCACRSHQVTRA